MSLDYDRVYDAADARLAHLSERISEHNAADDVDGYLTLTMQRDRLDDFLDYLHGRQQFRQEGDR